MSRDGGETFNNEMMQELWGSFYFLSDDLKIHSKTKYSITDLLGDIGGLFEVFHIVLVILLSPLNNMKFFNKAIRAVYFKETANDLEESVYRVRPVKFNMKHSYTKWCFGICKRL